MENFQLNAARPTIKTKLVGSSVDAVDRAFNSRVEFLFKLLNFALDQRWGGSRGWFVDILERLQCNGLFARSDRSYLLLERFLKVCSINFFSASSFITLQLVVSG